MTIPNKFLIKYIIALVLLLGMYQCSPVAVPSPAVVSQLETYNCLYGVVLHEAESESIKGKQAVADVVINRLRHKNYPSSVCEVVQQHKQFSNISKTLSKPLESLYTASTARVNAEVAKVAYESLQTVLNKSQTNVNALFYHASYVRPAWSKHKRLVAVIGKHKFYT
jgi:spore germination cell wall hydrolase CwlJ-like protein